METTNISFYHAFVIPFLVGVGVLFAVIIYKYARWFRLLPGRDKRLVRQNFFSAETLKGVWECISECLLHRKIWRVNPVLCYMHTAFALGWFLLIVVGWAETIAYLGWRMVPLQGHIFFQYFTKGAHHWLVMDILLFYVLSGLVLALFKRVRSRALGMKKTTKLTIGDRVAMTALWFVFPLRLTAESLGTELWAWWCYSIALGVFFVAMPFSRYMHIFTEVPLIFMRRWGIRSGEREKSFDRFQLEACSRCGICIDPCQLQRDAGCGNVQSAYFIRDRRYGHLTREVADNCLMCGRCQARCPVGLELDTLRLNSRHTLNNAPSNGRYGYIKGLDGSVGEGRVGYFAGCMTLLSPRILRAMEHIFTAVGQDVWRADTAGGVCCGRPLKLSGETDAARDMMAYNLNLFRKHKISTLVTSCPICLRVFREDYALDGIEVLHHSEYIQRLLAENRLKLLPAGHEKMAYHDPCELGRGCGIYDEPREILRAIGTLVEPAETRENALCCGSSLANIVVNDRQQVAMSRGVGQQLEETGATQVVTACPLCKKAIARGTSLPTLDLAEVVANHLEK